MAAGDLKRVEMHIDVANSIIGDLLRTGGSKIVVKTSTGTTLGTVDNAQGFLRDVYIGSGLEYANVAVTIPAGSVVRRIDIEQQSDNGNLLIVNLTPETPEETGALNFTSNGILYITSLSFTFANVHG